MNAPTAIVVGAGAAGLSAAHRLSRCGHQVLVLESSDVVGGRCRTVERDGFRFDLGAGALPDTYDAVVRLAADLGMLEEFEPRGAVIGTLAGGAVHRIDRRRPWTFLQAEHLAWRDKTSLWKLGVDLARAYRSIDDGDLSSAAAFDVETVAEWVRRRRLPDGARDLFIFPLCRALFLVEPEQTSVVDLFGALKSLLVAGYLLTHPEGVGAVLERAAAGLDVRLGASVTSVRRTGGGVEVSWTDETGDNDRVVDGCVVAVPASVVPGIVRDLDPASRDYLSALDHSTSFVVHYAIERPDESASMVLIPRCVEPAVPVVAFGHNLGPTRAPDGYDVVTAFAMTEWSRRHWDDDDEIVADALAAKIDRIMPTLGVGGAELRRVTRWNPALVASRPGVYRDLVRTRLARQRGDRLQLAGDYFARSSVNAAVRAGELAVERLSCSGP